ncbi:Rap1a/Tai family immunity protein [Bradyrhizobium tropiciagri]|uniref:Rap1a/Tai family immunity protein n=1 Tax=Bradyrhizobium tropiciagri TaxID=312253 RepID=UPI003D9BA174
MNFQGIFAASVWVLVSSVPSLAEEDFASGNFMLQHCQHFIDRSNNWDAWDGECSGAISTLTFLGSALPPGYKVCAPKGVTKLQAARVVVNYMLKNPQTLQDPFRVLAMQALTEAWPCK